MNQLRLPRRLLSPAHLSGLPVIANFSTPASSGLPSREHPRKRLQPPLRDVIIRELTNRIRVNVQINLKILPYVHSCIYFPGTGE